MTSLPERLRWAREIAGISQRELSRLAGLTERHVSMIESSSRPNLAVDTVSGLAEALGTTIDWLVRGEGEQPDPEAIRKAAANAKERFTAEETPSGAEAAS